MKKKTVFRPGNTAASLCLLLVCSVFVFWKCRYGFGNNDEAFYLTIPLRLIQGDRLVVDEWHVSQLSSVFLVPPLRLFLLIRGSTDSVILVFRYIYAAVQTAMSVLVFFRLKRYHTVGAVLAAAAFLLYAPFGVSALSYNSLGIIFMEAVSLSLLRGCSASKHHFFSAGIFFACAVLCCPHLVFVYILYALCLAVSYTSHKFRSIFGGKDSVRHFLFFSAGCIIAAVLFLLYILPGNSLEDIAFGIRHILDDPEHSDGSSGFSGIAKALKSISALTRGFDMAYIAILIIAMFDHRRTTRKSGYLLAASTVTSAWLVFLFLKLRYINFFLLPLNVLSVFCVLFSSEKDIRLLFKTLCLPGILYSFAIMLSSNQQVYALSSASVVSLVGSLLIIAMTAYQLCPGGGICKPSHPDSAASASATVMDAPSRRGSAVSSVSLKAAVLIFFVFLPYMRLTTVLWEAGMRDQTCSIAEGPEKGLLVSQERLDEYASRMLDISFITGNGSIDRVLYVSENTWLYLFNPGQRNGSYSAWLSGMDEKTLSLLCDYYSRDPDHIPDAVFVESGNTLFQSYFTADGSYEATVLPSGCTLYTQKCDR